MLQHSRDSALDPFKDRIIKYEAASRSVVQPLRAILRCAQDTPSFTGAISLFAQYAPVLSFCIFSLTIKYSRVATNHQPLITFLITQLYSRNAARLLSYQ